MRHIILRSLLIVATPYESWHPDECVTWLIHLCDMSHDIQMNAWHDIFIRATWLKTSTWIRDMTYSLVWYESWHLNECVTWLSYMCDLTRDIHMNVWHDSFIREIWVMTSTWMCDMTHLYVWLDSGHPHEYVTWPIPLPAYAGESRTHDAYITHITHITHITPILLITPIPRM